MLGLGGDGDGGACKKRISTERDNKPITPTPGAGVKRGTVDVHY